jgi:hypothetical protein
MRLGDLLGSAVVDADGRRVGTVRDVRIRPVSGDMSVTGIVIGDGPLAGMAHSWGYAERRACGPWPFEALMRRARITSAFVRAADIARWDVGRVALRAGARPVSSGEGASP